MRRDCIVLRGEKHCRYSYNTEIKTLVNEEEESEIHKVYWQYIHLVMTLEGSVWYSAIVHNDIDANFWSANRTEGRESSWPICMVLKSPLVGVHKAVLFVRYSINPGLQEKNTHAEIHSQGHLTVFPSPCIHLHNIMIITGESWSFKNRIERVSSILLNIGEKVGN